MKVLGIIIIIVFLTGCQIRDEKNEILVKNPSGQSIPFKYDSIFGSINSNLTKEYEGFLLLGLTSDLKDSTKIYLTDPYSNINMDSTFIMGNKFQLKGSVNDFKRIYIRTEDYSQWKTIWIENSKMIFDARNTTFKKAKVVGSKLQDQDNEWFNTVEVLDMKNDSIEDIMKNTPWYNIFRKISLGISLCNYHIKIPKANKNFIKSHPDYFISSYALSFLMHDIKTKQTEVLYNTLSNSVKESEYGRQVKLYLANPNQLKIGDYAIDFTLRSNEGNEVSLSSFKGHYVLLEFWASWCGPCLEEIPNLLNAYTRFNLEGFEILSISLDESEIAWRTAMEKDNMTWTHVSDLKGMGGEVALKYKVGSIPKNLLIDPEGVIINQNLRGDDLQKALEKIFD